MQALVDAKIRETNARIKETEARTAIKNERATAERARLDALNNANIAGIVAGRNFDGGNASFGADGQNDGEVPPEASAISPLSPGPPTEQIIAIFRNRFQTKNIYKLRMLGDFDDEENTRKVVVPDGKLKVNEKKYRKEFGNDASIWGAGFLNYDLWPNSASTPRHFNSFPPWSYRRFEYLPLAESATTNGDRIP